MTEHPSSLSPALVMLHEENPFSPDVIRSRQRTQFPIVDPRSLSRREGKIYQKAREDGLAIGLTGVKGTLAVAETDALEDFTTARFLATSNRIAHRLRTAHAQCPHEELSLIHI